MEDVTRRDIERDGIEHQLGGMAFGSRNAMTAVREYEEWFSKLSPEQQQQILENEKELNTAYNDTSQHSTD